MIFRFRFVKFCSAIIFLIFISSVPLHSKQKPKENADDQMLKEATLDIMVKSLEGKDPLMKPKIIRRISMLGDKDGISPLIFILLNSDEAVESRREAAKGAMALGGEVNYAPLLRLLDGTPITLTKTIKALLDISDRRFVEPLARYSTLGSIDNSNRKEATRAFLKIMGSEDKNFDLKILNGTKGELSLIEVAKDSGNSLQPNAIFVLGEIRSKRSIDTLVKNLSSKNYAAKSASIRALSKIKDKKAYKPLGELLRTDPSLSTKEECVKALIEMGSNEGVAEIDKSYRKEGFQNKAHILKSLDAINNPQAKYLFQKLLDSEKDPAVKKNLKAKVKEDSWY